MVASIGATAKVTRLGKEYVQVEWLTGHTKTIAPGTVFKQKDGGYGYEQFEPVLEIGKQMFFDFMYDSTKV